MLADLRLGRWQEVLADVEHVDALIVDAPYSERTHTGHDEGTADANRVTAKDEQRLRVDRRNGAVYAVGAHRRRSIRYRPWTADDVKLFVAFWASRTAGWFVAITDHVLAPAWDAALLAAGRYTFPPLPFVETGSRVRIAGDGPSSWTCWMIVARPSSRAFQRWGTLPGSYIDANERKPIVGGKPLGLMRALIRDYTRPGDLVCDPCAGGGTTLLAALMEGRRAIGAEMMPEHYEIARKRLARGHTAPLFAESAGRVDLEQLELVEEP